MGAIVYPCPQRGPLPSSTKLLQPDMAHSYVNPRFLTKVLRQLLGKVDRPMLTSSTAERHHQILETAALIVTNSRVYEGHCTCEKLMNALVLNQIFNYLGVLS